jgi:hypothetical protein
MKRYCKNSIVMNSTFCFQTQSWNLVLTKFGYKIKFLEPDILQMRCLKLLLYRTKVSI